MYDVEHKELFAGIRSGNHDQQRRLHGTQHDDGHHGTNGVLHRRADRADKALNSTEDLTPACYELGDVPVPEVAMPGITKFV